MISINYKGLFGNKLFEVSVANFLSKKHNQEINTNWNKFLKINKPSNPTKTSGQIIVNDKNIEEVFNTENLTHDLVLDDFFQTKFCTQKFIEYNEYENTVDSLIDATIIHMRLGDVKANNMSIEYDYYDEAIQKIENKKIFITSDSPHDEMLQRLAKEHNAEVYTDTKENTIMFAANCKNKILSAGSFSFWIGFLGSHFLKDQNGITICPKRDRSVVWYGDIFPAFDWEQI